MPKQELSLKQKKEWAEHLFTRDNLTQKEIAFKVGTSEQTMVKWAREGNWDAKRKSLLTTKNDQLSLLYEMLDLVNKAGIESLKDNNPATNPDADRIIKLTAAIKKLESDTGIGEMIDTLKALISFAQKEDFEAAQTINKWGDLFIKDRLSTLKS